MPDRTSRQIVLKDGRKLGYAEYGTPNGKPVFFFHGTPSSRLEGWRLDKPARRLNARIIASDRPGIGLSDFKAGRRYLDWPDDVIELADSLGIDRFALLGVSAGGPYAMTCALKIPHLLTAVQVVSSPCPFTISSVTRDLTRFQRLMVIAVRRAPCLAWAWLGRIVRKGLKDPVDAMSKVNGEIAEADKLIMERTIYNNSEELNAEVANFRESFRSGIRGVAWEYSLLIKPWGFSPEDISMQIELWHGQEDRTVPPSMGRYLASTVPNCRASFLTGEGHLLLANHVEDVLKDLVA